MKRRETRTGAAIRDDAGLAAEGGDGDRIGKTERILNLVSFLLKEREPVPFRVIAASVEGYRDATDPKSLERKFERDKQALKEMGIHISYVTSGPRGDGYLLRPQDCFLDRLELAPHEAALLNLVSELAIRKGGEAFSADLMTALQKLRFDSPPPPGTADPGAGPGGSAAWERSLIDLDLMSGLRADPNLEPLVTAILRGRRVAFTYYAITHDETRRREIEPYGLGYFSGAWYVTGFDLERRATRSFRLDRIRGAVEGVGPDRAFEAPRGFRIGDHLRVAEWRLGAEAAAGGDVAIEVGPAIAWFVEDLLASPEAIEERPDGSAVLRIRERDRGAFLRWALGHLRHVRILGPDDLREALRAELEAIRGLYLEVDPALAPSARAEAAAAAPADPSLGRRGRPRRARPSP